MFSSNHVSHFTISNRLKLYLSCILQEGNKWQNRFSFNVCIVWNENYDSLKSLSFNLYGKLRIVQYSFIKVNQTTSHQMSKPTLEFNNILIEKNYYMDHMWYYEEICCHMESLKWSHHTVTNWNITALGMVTHAISFQTDSVSSLNQVK